MTATITTPPTCPNCGSNRRDIKGKPAKVNSADSFNAQGQPNLEVQRLAVRVRELEQDIAQWKTWGIVEIAVRNPSVASYCEDWERRALAAEIQVRTLTQGIQDRAQIDAENLRARESK